MITLKTKLFSAAALGLALSFAVPADAQVTRQNPTSATNTPSADIKGVTPNKAPNAKDCVDIDIKAKNGAKNVEDSRGGDKNRVECGPDAAANPKKGVTAGGE